MAVVIQFQRKAERCFRFYDKKEGTASMAADLQVIWVVLNIAEAKYSKNTHL